MPGIERPFCEMRLGLVAVPMDAEVLLDRANEPYAKSTIPVLSVAFSEV